MQTISQIREKLPPRHWHVIACFLAGMGLVVGLDLILGGAEKGQPGLKQIWYLALAGPLTWGAVIAAFGRGAARWRRVIGAAACGAVIGAGSAVASGMMMGIIGPDTMAVFVNAVWRTFVFTIGSVIGALLAEILMPIPVTEQPQDDRYRNPKQAA